MVGATLKWFGAASLVALVLGGTFVGGARYGARAALEAVSAKVAQAKAARAQPAKLGPVPAAPDPTTIASPVTPAPTPAPKSGTIRRYEGDRLVSEEPVR